MSSSLTQLSLLACKSTRLIPLIRITDHRVMVSRTYLLLQASQVPLLHSLVCSHSCFLHSSRQRFRHCTLNQCPIASPIAMSSNLFYHFLFHQAPFITLHPAPHVSTLPSPKSYHYYLLSTPLIPIMPF